MESLMEWVLNLINNFGRVVVQLLPTSPFRDFIDSWQAPDYLGWLNWFVPVSQIITILVAWLGAIALFYLYSIIMRWVKMIGD